jgi:hypothetical protein
LESNRFIVNSLLAKHFFYGYSFGIKLGKFFSTRSVKQANHLLLVKALKLLHAHDQRVPLRLTDFLCKPLKSFKALILRRKYRDATGW